MDYEISGMVVDPRSKSGIPNVIVAAFDKDPIFDDFLGEVLSDAAGAFRIVYDEKKFKGLFEKAPDLYLVLKTVNGDVLLSTKDAVRKKASAHETFQVELPAAAIDKAGLTTAQPLGTVSRETLTHLTCLDGAPDDDLVKQIRNDLDGKASVLELFKEYAQELAADADNDALAFRKMARLFEAGSLPEPLLGHFYGVAPGLRTGDLRGVAAEYGNFMGVVWGSVIGGQVPWVGKSFAPMADADRATAIGSAVPAAVPVARGINHFNVVEHAPINLALSETLTFMWHLRDAPEADHLRYGHEKNGGNFASHRAPSLYAGTPREVYRLNYRHAGLGNRWPLMYLVDELVGIASGLYLGQVLFATDHVFETYDPAAPADRYHYQHFGYFLLFDESWAPEARRLYPHLDMPDAAVRMRIVGELQPKPPSPKFTTLKLAGPGDGNVDPAALAAIRKELQQAGTVMHLLKSYADQISPTEDTHAPAFAKLGTLFNAGIGPKHMNGFYRGALISWQTQGLLAVANTNTVKIAWELSRRFSPWTGKRFDPVDKQRLGELTEGSETNEADTFFCANTVVWRTAKEKVIQTLSRAANVWTEDASADEKRQFGYDAKNFFFIGKQAPSINPDNNGKPVFQLNYRWPALRNIVPDRFCIDELVEIAEGLFLGQLFYATNWLDPWNPRTPVATYKYGLFAYFLVMDEEWHARRLKLGFDLDDT
ncbi:MAG TPA: hypothetical protein VGP07_10770 [Polyangia bacterium]|jgi:hypothetical protein